MDKRFDALADEFKEAAVEALGFSGEWCNFTADQVQAVLDWKPAGRKRSGPVNRVVAASAAHDIMEDTRNCIARAKQTHAVPTSVIKKTLKKRGMNPDGTLIHAAKKIILATGCIEIVEAAVKPGWQFINNALQWVTGRAAQYRIVKWGWFKFLAHHAPLAQERPKQAAPDPQTVKAAPGHCRTVSTARRGLFLSYHITG
jgi:hypothetical protein